ncbi:MAG: hypothetical protein ACREPX_05440 [Rhodanobacteraceae bacterium]
MIRWLDTTEVTEFADTICKEYGRLRKSVEVRMDDASKRVKKFEKLTQKVVDFNSTRRLNFYKKAKMINEIKFGLKAQNVPEDEISAFVDSLVLSGIPGGKR